MSNPEPGSLHFVTISDTEADDEERSVQHEGGTGVVRNEDGRPIRSKPHGAMSFLADDELAD
jgi:hypothetical protein